MSDAPSGAVTRILQAATRGEARAADELLPLVYNELRSLAHALMSREASGATLQPTALVHEAYLRLVGDEDPGWDGRAHFFGAAAKAMRRILVDRARRKGRPKHGGDRARVNIDTAELPIAALSESVLALDEALRHLEVAQPRAANVVMLRYFAGLKTAEVAACLSISSSTVEREWRFARTVLYTQLAEPSGDGRTGEP